MTEEEFHQFLLTYFCDGMTAGTKLRDNMLTEHRRSILAQMFPGRDPDEVWAILESAVALFDAEWSKRGSFELSIQECRLWYWLGYLAAMDTVKLPEN